MKNFDISGVFEITIFVIPGVLKSFMWRKLSGPAVDFDISRIYEKSHFEILIFTKSHVSQTPANAIALLFQESCRFRGGVSSKKGGAAVSVTGSQPVT